ncbi:MAG: ATP-binding cassette domain-containing protein [Bacteroidota bacterium]|nr:ATP-binding cassette domain-containing protein [Bacteroidota bacterium]
MKTTSALLRVSDLSVQRSGRTVLRDIHFTIQPGEHMAVIGPSGSGKTTLIQAIAGNCAGSGTVLFGTGEGKRPSMAVIAQQHSFTNLSHLSSFYYQQRFNSADSEDSQNVTEALQEMGFTESAIQDSLSLLGITHIRSTRLIQLSNGEHKRFQLSKAILQKAEWLLLDNPYTGLDKEARKLLNQILDTLVDTGVHIFLVSAPADIPASITQVALLEKGRITGILKPTDYLQLQATGKGQEPDRAVRNFRSVPAAYPYPDFSVAVKMVNAAVQYDDRKILDNINWEVKKGECWNVSGHNGSGKSTLLSLVNGDNPQAFANEIYLFDRRKGSGESIWDIKQKIGYVSPELHHYFDVSATGFEVVASGLFDTIGLFRQLTPAQKELTAQWISLLHLEGLDNSLFNQLSHGEQRRFLLARALVKNPPLLILDEPCQGLDREAATDFIALINEICIQLRKTLIYVSHYSEEIPACVTHTLALEQGRVAA